MHQPYIPRQDEFFDPFYEKYYQSMCRYAHSILKNPHKAEEVVQDAFLEVAKKIDYLRQCPNPERWLQVTVKNKALCSLRSHLRDSKHCISLEYDVAAETTPSGFSGVSEAYQRVLCQTIENDVRNALTTEEYTILRMAAFKSYKEISSELGLSVAACQKRVQRVRKKLKKRDVYVMDR